MKRFNLNELPAPPVGRYGWPWTEGSQSLPPNQPVGSSWPKISVVTPSYNQGRFIEETIRAVLLQGYPDLEFIIIDGGSQDETVSILKKYEPWLAYWVSEKDRGQTHALNKGFERATGQIFYWINSDDLPEEDVFNQVARQFSQWPEADVIFGDMTLIDQDGQKLKFVGTSDFTAEEEITRNRLVQPSVFFKSELWHKFGPARESLQFIMDYELWLRWLLEGVKFKHFSGSRVFFRLHSNSKTTNLRHIEQNETIALLFELRDNGKLPPEFYPCIARSLKTMCRDNYAFQDAPQFLVTYRHYKKEVSHIDFSLFLARWLLVLGKSFNNFLLRTRSRLLNKA